MHNSSCCRELSNYKFPLNPKYFAEDIITNDIKIPCEKPDIKQIVSIDLNIDIVSTRLAKTSIAISNEGQELSGYKLIVELKFNENIKYVSNTPCKSVHLASYDNIFKNISVVIPSNINCIDVEELFRKHKIKVTPIIEDISTKIIDRGNLFQSILYFVNVTFLN